MTILFQPMRGDAFTPCLIDYIGRMGYNKAKIDRGQIFPGDEGVMAILAWIFGLLGAFCAMVGIITALEIIPLVAPALTWTFWMAAGANRRLIAIACAIPANRPRGE